MNMHFGNTSVNPTFEIGSGGTIYSTAHVSVGGGQIITPSGVNLALNPNTGVVQVGGVVQSSGTGNNTFAGSILIAAGKNLFFDGGSNTYIKESSADVLSFYTGGTERFRIDNGGIVIRANDKHLFGLTTGNATIQLIGVRGDNYVEIGHSGYGVVTGTGNWALDGADNMTVNASAYFAEYLYHTGDTDTNIRFETDQITLAAEGGASGTGNHLTLGNDGTMYFSASQDLSLIHI